VFKHDYLFAQARIVKVWFAQNWIARRNNTYRLDSAAPSVQVSKRTISTLNIICTQL